MIDTMRLVSGALNEHLNRQHPTGTRVSLVSDPDDPADVGTICCGCGWERKVADLLRDEARSTREALDEAAERGEWEEVSLLAGKLAEIEAVV